MAEDTTAPEGNEEQDSEIEGVDDILDVALSKLIDDVVGSEAVDDDLDDASESLFDAIEDLVADEKIEEIPPEDATDEVKQKWLDNSLQQVEAAFREEMKGSEDTEDGHTGLE